MDNVFSIIVWPVAFVLLILGVLALALAFKRSLTLNLRGLGIEVNLKAITATDQVVCQTFDGESP